LNMGILIQTLSPSRIRTQASHHSKNIPFILNTPPLLSILLSLVYRVTEIHEWAARMLLIAFSLACLLLLFEYTRRILNTRIAIGALGIAALIPMAGFYGQHVDVQGSVTLAAILSILLAYKWWTESFNRRPAQLMCALFVLGTFSDWPVFYLALLIPWHFIISGVWRDAPGKSAVLPILALPILGASMFTLFFMETLRRGYGGAIIGGFIHRISTNRLEHPESLSVYTLSEWVDKVGVDFTNLFTIPVCALVIIWAVATILLKKHAGKAVSWVWLLLLVGIIHVALGRQGAWVHDYWGHYVYPGAAIASAVSLSIIWKFMTHIKIPPIATRIVAILCIVLWSASSISVTGTRAMSQKATTSYWRDMGRVVRQSTRPHQYALTSEYVREMLNFYSHRRMVGQVTTPESLDELLKKAEGRAPIFVMAEYQQRRYPEMAKELKSRYPSRTDGMFTIFSLTQKQD